MGAVGVGSRGGLKVPRRWRTACGERFALFVVSSSYSSRSWVGLGYPPCMSGLLLLVVVLVVVVVFPLIPVRLLLIDVRVPLLFILLCWYYCYYYYS